ncbi:Protein DOWNY MILDEW RESISTANCE 6 [Linum perenne]
MSIKRDAADCSYDFPVIDLSPFFITDHHNDEEDVIRKIREACSEYGFFVALNHGIPPELMDQSLQVARDFFNFSTEDKLKWGPLPEAPLPAGYVKQPDHSPNKNEYFGMFAPGSSFNVYPTNPPHFREIMDSISGQLLETAKLIERLVNDSLGLPKGLLERFNDDRKWDVMTAFHYFPATEKENTGVYAHKDMNLLTLVLQDQVGGLEFLRDGVWIPITPIPHSLVVNVGDVIQVLSNDKYKSSTHRVRSQMGKDRYSYAFAYLIGAEKWVQPLVEVMEQTKESPKFRGFEFKEYIQMRLANLKNPPANLDDVVTVHHYAIPPHSSPLTK